MDLAAVVVPVGSDEQPRLDLAESIEHALYAEVGRTRRPRGSNRGAAERRHNRFRNVGDEARNAIAGLNARSPQRICESSDFTPELARADGPMDPVFTVENQRRSIVGAAQQVLGEVEPGAGKEARAGHALEALGDAPAPGPANVREIPDRRPELVGPIQRELIERGVVAQADPPLMLESVSERRDGGRRDAFGRRRPEWGRHSPGLYDPAGAGPGV